MTSARKVSALWGCRMPGRKGTAGRVVHGPLACFPIPVQPPNGRVGLGKWFKCSKRLFPCVWKGIITLGIHTGCSGWPGTTKGWAQCLVPCECSINVLVVSVPFASSVTTQGRRGLTAGGERRRSSQVERVRSLSWSGGERQSREGDVQILERAGWGCEALDQLRTHPERGWRG